MIGIVNYNAGNIKNLSMAFKRLGEETILVNQPSDLERIERLVFPGVGEFGSAMSFLEDYELYSPIRDWVLNNKHFLGICLGLQVLFESSEEAPGSKGLGIFKGEVVKFNEGKVPQIGWNVVNSRTKRISSDYYYFVNSYYVLPKDETIIASTTEYYQEFCSAISIGNTLALQFHPERSGNAGMILLKGWISC